MRLDAFRPEALGDPRIRALMPKIGVSEDAALAADYPRKRQARLTVTLVDGRRLEHFQAVRKGDPEAPLSDAELIAKFDELAGSVADLAAVATLRDTILEGDHLPGPVAFSDAGG